MSPIKMIKFLLLIYASNGKCNDLFSQISELVAVFDLCRKNGLKSL